MIVSRPMYIMALVDEESKFPKGTNQSCLEKLHKFYSSHKCYIKPKSSAIHAFKLTHFAGNVEYYNHGFLEKNRNTFSGDLMQLIQTSTNLFWLVCLRLICKLTRRRSELLRWMRSLKNLSMLNSCSPFFIRWGELW